MENSYSAKISIRSGGKYCVKFPKKLIESKEFSLGDVVEVSIKKAEVTSDEIQLTE